LTRRWRSPRYGAAIGLTLIGVACGATMPGTLGGTLATALIGFGLVGVVSLVFYEIGLSEDRDRARAQGTQTKGHVEAPAPPSPEAARAQPTGERGVGPRRLSRGRGERRRLR
jgi:hypothetical protein